MVIVYFITLFITFPNLILRAEEKPVPPYVLIGETGVALSTQLEGNWAPIFTQGYQKTLFVNCSPMPYLIDGEQYTLQLSERYKHIPVRANKIGKAALLQALKELVPLITMHLQSNPDAPTQPLVVIHSFESMEIPVCICLAVLPKLFDFNGMAKSEFGTVTNIFPGHLRPTMVEHITKEDMGKYYLLVDKYLPQVNLIVVLLF